MTSGAPKNPYNGIEGLRQNVKNNKKGLTNPWTYPLYIALKKALQEILARVYDLRAL